MRRRPRFEDAEGDGGRRPRVTSLVTSRCVGTALLSATMLLMIKSAPPQEESRAETVRVRQTIGEQAKEIQIAPMSETMRADLERGRLQSRHPLPAPRPPPEESSQRRLASSSTSVSTGCSTVHVAINSAVGYEVPRAALLASLRRAGVPMGQVHVFIAGASAATSGSNGEAGAVDEHGTRSYFVPHNSFDFSGLIHVVEHPKL